MKIEKTLILKDTSGNSVAVAELPQQVRDEVEKLDHMKNDLNDLKYKMELHMCAINFKAMQISELVSKLNTKPDGDENGT